jgi:hypothetical protein
MSLVIRGDGDSRHRFLWAILGFFVFGAAPGSITLFEVMRRLYICLSPVNSYLIEETLLAGVNFSPFRCDTFWFLMDRLIDASSFRTSFFTLFQFSPISI